MKIFKAFVLSIIILIGSTVKVEAYVNSQDELNLLYAIVMLESGNVPVGNRAVASTIINRVNSEEFPDTVTEVVAQPGQFESYGHELSWQYMNGNVPQSVKDNVNYILENGATHSFKFFWADWYYYQSGRYDADAMNLGGNIFFNY